MAIFIYHFYYHHYEIIPSHMAEIAPTDHLVGNVWEENAFGQSPQFVTMFFGKNVTESTKRNKFIDNCR